MRPDPAFDRVCNVAASLSVLSRLVFDSTLDAHGIAGIAAMLELLADELDRVLPDMENASKAA